MIKAQESMKFLHMTKENSEKKCPFKNCEFELFFVILKAVSIKLLVNKKKFTLHSK